MVYHTISRKQARLAVNSVFAKTIGFIVKRRNLNGVLVSFSHNEMK
jgi:hypothetical protein